VGLVALGKQKRWGGLVGARLHEGVELAHGIDAVQLVELAASLNLHLSHGEAELYLPFIASGIANMDFLFVREVRS